MGVPTSPTFTAPLMPVIHIYPINPGTGQYVTIGEIKEHLAEKDNTDITKIIAEANDSDRFDLGVSLNFQRMTLDWTGETAEASFEFIDPTFAQFESLMAAINRDATNELVGQLNFMIQFGWVANSVAPEQIVYPLFRDKSLREGGRIRLVDGELLCESLFIRIYNVTYSIQTSGIKYIMTGPYIAHDGEQLFSQSTKVFEDSANLSYLTILYYLASEMNVLIKFDANTNVDLLTHGPSRFACEGKSNIDNLARLIDVINKGGDRDKSTLNCTVSSNQKDAEDAMRQMGDISKQSLIETARINNKLDDLFSFRNQAVTSVAVTAIAPLLGPIAASGGLLQGLARGYLESKSTATLFKLPESERIKAQTYISRILQHWQTIKNSSGVKDWKTYVISEFPGMYSSDTQLAVVSNPDSSMTILDKSKIFLGVYSHFSKDSEAVPRTSNGYDTSVGMITSTGVTLDDSMLRITQKKEYSHTVERTGILISHYFDLWKTSQPTLATEVNKTAKAVQAANVNATVTRIQDKKQPQLSPVIGNFVNPVNQLLRPITFPILLPLAQAAEALTNPVVQGQANNQALLKQQEASYLGIPLDSSQDTILKAAGDKIGELSNNDYIKRHHLLDRISRDVENKLKQYVTPSLNPEDKDYKIIKQIAIYSAVKDIIREPNAMAAKDLSYNKNNMVITVKTVGDLALYPDLMCNAVLYIKFFNNNGTLNLMLTGFYLIMGHRHEITSTGTFNTEMTLQSLQLKGISESQASAALSDRNIGTQQAKNESPWFPPPPNGGLAAATATSTAAQEQLAKVRSFTDEGVTYTKNAPVTITKVNTPVPPLPTGIKIPGIPGGLSGGVGLPGGSGLPGGTIINLPKTQPVTFQFSALQQQQLSKITSGSAVGIRMPPVNPALFSGALL